MVAYHGFDPFWSPIFLVAFLVFTIVMVVLGTIDYIKEKRKDKKFFKIKIRRNNKRL